MHVHYTIYRGYSIYLTGADSKWSVRVEPLTPDFPILSRPVSDGYRSWGRAYFQAKRQIDRILVY
jgi:hypothetical protein